MHRPFKTKKARIVLLIGAVLLVFLVREGVSQAMSLHMLSGLVQQNQNTPQKNPGSLAQSISQSAQEWDTQSIEVYAQPTAMPTPTAKPGATPTKSGKPTATLRRCPLLKPLHQQAQGQDCAIIPWEHR